MNTYIASVYLFRDLENSKLAHKSITGTRATHSFEHVNEHKGSDLVELKKRMEHFYGPSYDVDVESGFHFHSIEESEWSEAECPENYEIIYKEVTEKVVL